MTKRHIYTFGAFRLDAQQKIFLRNGERIPLHPKTLMMLLVLVESGGAVVTKDELLAKIWPDTFVGENSLTKNISILRKALGNGLDHLHYIETIPTIGYRFVAPVQQTTDSGAEAIETIKLEVARDHLGSSMASLWRPRWGRNWLRSLAATFYQMISKIH